MRRVLLIALVGVALSGCASLEPTAQPPQGDSAESQAPTSPTTPSPIAQAQATHEYPEPAPPRQAASGSASAVGAVTAFATAYINWNADTVAADMQALAGQSVGQARSAMELAAAQTGSDYEVRRGGIANSGTVEAVAPLRGPPNRYVVVTRERTTATATNAYQGLQPAWHVAIATVVLVAPGRWAVSGWQPEG
jgi:type IV pilus biogenesis protein CpaD/CtpE